MSDFCDFCSVYKPPSNTRNVEDSGLLVFAKFYETFKIKLPDNFRIICCDCITKLNQSYSFYQQVQQVIDLLENVKPEIPEVVEVKVEELSVHIDHLSALELSKWTPGDGIDEDFFNNSSEPENRLSPKRKRIKKEPQVTTRSPTKRQHKKPEKFTYPRPEPKKKIKRGKLKPISTERFPRGNPLGEDGFKIPGTRSTGVKQVGLLSRVTMLDVFPKEIAKKKFAEPPETMDIPAEDKLKYGRITPRAIEEISRKTWGDFWWNCNVSGCSTKTTNIIDLKDHLRIDHSIPNFISSCIDCGKETLNHGAYINHAATHNPNLRFCCLFCSEFRHNYLDLYKHYAKDHEGKKVFFCLYCGRYEISASFVNIHVVKKHRKEEAKFECDICGLKTIMKIDLGQHMMNVHRNEMIQCDVCSKTYKTLIKLNAHKRTIHMDIRHLCQECGKSFRKRTLFKRHIREKHSEENLQVACEVCSKIFPTARHLKKHMIVHDPSEGKFKCTYCERVFKRAKGLQIHVRCTHTGEKPYKCSMPNCTARFYDYANGLKHIRGTHDSDRRPIKITSETENVENM